MPSLTDVAKQYYDVSVSVGKLVSGSRPVTQNQVMGGSANEHAKAIGETVNSRNIWQWVQLVAYAYGPLTKMVHK